ncbi:hypothetical protein J6590_106076 [Homalodisca vitripennis]|nr:hypothetical protein J6590_106076 [Homalodisca vitripennis]
MTLDEDIIDFVSTAVVVLLLEENAVDQDIGDKYEGHGDLVAAAIPVDHHIQGFVDGISRPEHSAHIKSTPLTRTPRGLYRDLVDMG